MKLTLNGIKEAADWKEAGIVLPSYDVAEIAEKTKEAPVWVHFGAGNIFRIFIGGLADKLISQGEMEKGITYKSAYFSPLIRKSLFKELRQLIYKTMIHFVQHNKIDKNFS